MTRPNEQRERNEIICARYVAGELVSAIAETYGITYQRVVQIVKREGTPLRNTPDRSPENHARIKREKKLAEVRTTIRVSRRAIALAGRANGLSASQIAKRHPPMTREMVIGYWYRENHKGDKR